MSRLTFEDLTPDDMPEWEGDVESTHTRARSAGWPERTAEEQEQRRVALERALQQIAETYGPRPSGLLRRQAGG